MTPHSIKIFVDFDGTITQDDVGESIFHRFGNQAKVEKIIGELLSDRISAKQSWIELCNSIDEVDINLLKDFINNIDIDPGFHKMVDFCENNNIPVIVLSDGFDYYIDIIFQREKLERLKYYSNTLTFSPENKLVPSFPYMDPGCRHSANCKRNHIINNSSDDDFTIYIGDGNSDKECALFCDAVFAKKSLLKFCEKERISFYPYNTFYEVIEKLSIILKKKNLRKRHQARLKRREVYITE
jgi:2-hydroxy-3-keto-5-methylthiopentenyl-1-phosphate phosphatase